MKKIFMTLLTELQKHGDLTAATLYKDGTYSNLTVESGETVYHVSILKEEKKED